MQQCLKSPPAARFNRNILGCKVVNINACFACNRDLIETYWDVKKGRDDGHCNYL